MNSSSHPGVRTVLIVKPDRLYAEALRQMTKTVLPMAHIRLECSLEQARLALAAEPVELLVTGIGVSLGGDAIDFLSGCAGNIAAARHVLVVTTHHELRLLAALRNLPIDGAFDSTTEPPEQFLIALQAVARGQFYWSRSLLERMHADPTTQAHPRLLTPCEQLVLSVIGGGSDNATAARELGMSIGTISSVRRDLHRKLHVQHRGELMRIAAQTGFVQFTPFGVVRPGYALLAAAYRTRRGKTDLAPAMA